MRNIIMTKPFIYFGTAIIITLFAANQPGFIFATAVFFAALTAAVILFFFRDKNRYTTIAFICTLAVFTSSASFCTRMVTDYLPAKSYCSDSLQTLSGRLIAYEQAYGNYYYTVDNVCFNGKATDITVRIHSKNTVNAEIDDTLTVTAATVYELGKSTGNTGSYKADGIYIGAYTTDIISVTPAEKHSVNYYLNEIRLYINNSLSALKNETITAVAVALLTGDTSSLDDSVIMNFRNSGISHLFAVSGFHLSFWTAGLTMLCDRLFKKKTKASAVVSIIFVLFFITLTGFTKSVIRSGIMMIIVLGGRLINRNSDSVNSLFFALSVILLINPFAVMSISLQLSALATLGIIILSAPTMQIANNISKPVSNPILKNALTVIITTLFISVAAGIFTMPVSAISLGNISLWAPVTNLLCLSAAQLIMILSAFSVLLSPVAALSKPLLIPVALLSKYILKVTEAIAKTEYSTVDTSSSTAKTVYIIATAVIFITIYIYRKNSQKLKNIMIASYSVIIAISLITATVQKSIIKITVPDTGNGTAIILNTGGKDIIIGCGGNQHKEYIFTSSADTNTMRYDILLIPRQNDTESSYMSTALDRYTFDYCIHPFTDKNIINSLHFPKNSYATDKCVINLDENCKLLYINNDRFTGARLESDGFTCTIIFKPGVDFSYIDSSWSKGNLLITRQSLPDADLSGFDNIIITSSSEKAYTQSNIYSTKHSGQITYSVYPFAFTTISEENNDFK